MSITSGYDRGDALRLTLSPGATAHEDLTAKGESLAQLSPNGASAAEDVRRNVTRRPGQQEARRSRSGLLTDLRVRLHDVYHVSEVPLDKGYP